MFKLIDRIKSLRKSTRHHDETLRFVSDIREYPDEIVSTIYDLELHRTIHEEVRHISGVSKGHLDVYDYYVTDNTSATVTKVWFNGELIRYTTEVLTFDVDDNGDRYMSMLWNQNHLTGKEYVERF